MQHSYTKRIEACIRAVLRNYPCTFEEIVRGCYGAYPLTVSEILSEMNIYCRFTQLYCTQQNEIPYLEGYETDLRQTELITYSVENNPILSNWYFSWRSCKRLCALDIWKGKKLLFLGTPRLFEYFLLHAKGAYLTLIDLDKYVTDALMLKYSKKTDASKIRIQNADINFIYEGEEKYDVVFLDPPWYLETYFSWIFKAATYTAPNGQIFMSVFPFLTRPTASEEREKIFKYCRSLAKSVLSIPEYLEYDIPSFEKSELIHANIDIRSNWKVSDLFILQNIIPVQSEKELFKQCSCLDLGYQGWTEFSLFGLRWFICEPPESSDANTLPLISFIDRSIYLRTPSYRNPQLKRANLQSSRGHGLYVSDVKKFMQIVNELKDKCRTLPTKEAVAQLDVDLNSKKILSQIGDECYG